MANAVRTLGEDSPLAAQLWESTDPASYELAAEECEAAARWSDTIVREKRRAGDDAGADYEMKKAQRNRARARRHRETAAMLRRNRRTA